jgi:hypothetical protein
MPVKILMLGKQVLSNISNINLHSEQQYSIDLHHG